MERCSAHSGIEEKLNNVEKALLQVMEELSKIKLTPGTAWVIGVMSSIIGGMGIWILDHIG